MVRQVLQAAKRSHRAWGLMVSRHIARCLAILVFALSILEIGFLQGCASPAVAPTGAPPTNAPTLIEVGVTVIATAPPLAVENETELLNKARRAVLLFYEIRTKADKSLDDSNLQSILMGEALEQQKQIMQTLRDKNCYWIFSNQHIRFDTWTVFSSNLIELNVTVTEDADLYCNGEKDRGSYNSDTPYRVGFRAERFSEHWFVTKRWRLH